MGLFGGKKLDFLSIGDVLTDAFIDLQDAEVHCDINNEHCTISMKFGDKIPYRSATVLRGVGNAANAAVAAGRIGLSSALLANTGDDDEGAKTFDHLKKEKMDLSFMRKQSGIPTNYHYVLRYGPERTILVRHESYTYPFPEKQLDTKKPAWIYFTSIAKESLEFHHQLAAWVKKNPKTKLAFQPGTFQLELGKEQLKDVYETTYALFCNKEEAQRISGTEENDFKKLHANLRALGPKIIVITDGPNGMTASESNEIIYSLPMYPDPKPPVDRTGAGDACSSTIITALYLGLPLEQAIMWGPVNSMSVVQYIGAQEGLLSREKIEEYLKNAPADYKVTTL